MDWQIKTKMHNKRVQNAKLIPITAFTRSDAPGPPSLDDPDATQAETSEWLAFWRAQLKY